MTTRSVGINGLKVFFLFCFVLFSSLYTSSSRTGKSPNRGAFFFFFFLRSSDETTRRFDGTLHNNNNNNDNIKNAYSYAHALYYLLFATNEKNIINAHCSVQSVYNNI